MSLFGCLPSSAIFARCRNRSLLWYAPFCRFWLSVPNSVGVTINATHDGGFSAPNGNATTNIRVPYSLETADALPLEGYAKIAEIQDGDEVWTAHEDYRKRDGNLVFASKAGQQRVFPKTAETYAPPAGTKYPRYAGLSIREVGLALKDILADQMLRNGEPIEEQVRDTIPALTQGPAWTSFVGNVQANDVVAVYAAGGTKPYHANLIMPEAGRVSRGRLEGYLGGWMPAIRKIVPVSESEYFETVVFGDVDAPDPFIVQTWHRVTWIRNGAVVKTEFGHSYPSFSSKQEGPPAADFYAALFKFGEYWTKHLADFTPLNLPDQSWVDMTKYAFAKELMTRPGGVYPRYGAFDRDYAGSEYDGFQDIFTATLSSNLEWGRFKHAKEVIDNYFTLFVSPKGDINMRGPEVGQFGLTLSLLTKYAQYTGDIATLERYKDKIIATAGVLVRLHEEGLALPSDNPGYGQIHGWSESDACLKGNPALYWKPYFANSAFTVRGFRDISTVDLFKAESADWRRRAEAILNTTISSINRSIFPNTNPPYVPPMPGVKATFRDAMGAAKGNSEQDWPHRLYAELLHANVLPTPLANQVVDTMRSYGATSMGVVANVAPTPSPATRDILGFISYGYALGLLYLDRIDEYVLFMYTHRYHVHSRGAWNAGEVTGTGGGASAFCVPAQLTIPNLVRWALVLEDQDEDRLFFGRGLPRAWLGTGKKISIKGAATRWGKVDYEIKLSDGVVRARINFERTVPKEFEVKLRVPRGTTLKTVTVNGKEVKVEKNEAVMVRSEGAKEFIIEGK
ncbi:hypothetical protein EJ08DRAFT_645112 [Tothia fuscella]|uniref:Tat pathway signal protein n=1 Tax=Tothia fuscella TaxID=1048955 RepID=A0A9P4U4M2_9PEZI|nr:hypothetical protein EJ08DRAFT_645112 [Tothia fuscella]